MICNTIEPVWEEEFVIELEGSENLRILVYEQQQNSPVTVLRGRATLELSRSISIPLSSVNYIPITQLNAFTYMCVRVCVCVTIPLKRYSIVCVYRYTYIHTNTHTHIYISYI